MRNITRRHLLAGASLAALAGMVGIGLKKSFAKENAGQEQFEVTHSEEEWQKILTPNQYAVLREEGTEPERSSPLNKEKRRGTYHCAGCDLPLFSSKTKYNSGTGWPSFYKPLKDAVATKPDTTLFTRRTEVHCRRCNGHLGHVFDDGPQPTGLRYCMNGLALIFKPEAA
jgi:peptide-methionine (R)-S-oxide reductase